MKILIWSVFALFALLWTGCIALSLALVDALSGALATGASAGWVQALQAWQVPAWLAPWADPQAVQVIKGVVAAAVDALQGAGPELGMAVGWLAPLLWLAWAVVLAAVLALAAGLHWLVGRGADPGPPPRPASAATPSSAA